MNIAQISDLHLTGDIAHADSYQRFTYCLNTALTYQPDFLLLTGDLVHDGKPEGYAWLFETLNQTRLPFACIAGNHDGTLEINTHLPFEQRQFLPTVFDTRLMDCQKINLDNWQLLLLNSAVPAQPYGHLNDKQLTWLEHTLAQESKPTIIAMHHHPIAVRSAWIDAYMLDNAADFWKKVDKYPHVHTVLCGHVHQAHTLYHQHIAVHTCPAIARQFAPLAESFTLDDIAMGFRLLHLTDDDYHTLIIRCPNFS